MIKPEPLTEWTDSLLSLEAHKDLSPAGTSPSRLIFLLGSVIFALIWSAVVWQAIDIKKTQFENFRQNLVHLTEVLDETLVRQLRQIDDTLLVLRTEYTSPHPNLPHTLNLLRHGPLQGLNIHVEIIDKNGKLVLSDIPGNSTGANLGHEPRLHFFAQSGDDQLQITDATVGPLAQEQGLQLSRPILSPDDSFLGVVAIFVPAEELTRFMRPLEIGSDTIMTVLSNSGKLLSRSENFLQYFGAQLTPEQIATYRSKANGYAMRPSVFDQVERGIAHRWLTSPPLLLVVSRSPAPVQAKVKADQQILLLIGVLTSLLVAVLLTLLGRSWRQNSRAKAQLQREHASLTNAQHIARMGSWEADISTGTLFWSDGIFSILGLDKCEDAASYRNYLHMVHPNDRKLVSRTYHDSLKSGQPFGITHRLHTPDGRIKWVRALCTSKFDARGKPLLSSGTLQDITERKRNELEREALSRERMLLLESTSEGIYGIDVKGICTFVNSAGTRLLGFTSDELIGHNIHALIHYQHADGTPYPEQDCPIIKAASIGNACKNTHEVFWNKDGMSFPVEYSASPIRDGELITGAVVTFSDITQRMHTEAMLRIAEKAFQTQEGMFVTDETGTILRINKAFTDITGYTAADIVGKNPRIRSSGRHNADFYAAMWEKITRTGAWKGEIWNRHKNGTIYPESVTVTAIKGDDTSVTHYVATIHDISARKTAEEQIHSLAFFDPLTKLPNRRLLQDRLQQALAASDRSKKHGALMFIDLDKFKQLNDTLGHDIGDLLLQQVALRLRQSIRQTDTVARFGGDEFVLLIEELGAQETEARLEAEQVGHKVLDALNQTYDLAGHQHHSTPSIGATLFCGQAQDWESLLKQADLAMYKSKADGRNTLSFFDPSLRDSAHAGPDRTAV